MLELITSALKYLGVVLLIVGLIKEVLSFINLSRYSKQKIRTFYYPLVGFGYRFVRYLPTNNQSQGIQNDAKFAKEELIAFNNGRGTSSFVVMTGAQAVKEFAQIEGQVSYRYLKSPVSVLGFFFQSGKDALRKRAVFSQIFNYDNLRGYCPILFRTINKRFDTLEQLIKKSPNKEIEFDLKNELYQFMIEDVSLKILLGTTEDLVDKEGNSLLKEVRLLGNTIVSLLFLSPVNDIMGGVFEKLGLKPEVYQIKKCQKKIKKLVLKEYYRRKEDKSKRDLAFFDIVINHNKKMQEENTPEHIMHENEICENIELFQAAASDSSYQTSSSLATMLALNPDIQEKLSKEINTLPKEKFENMDLATVDSLPYLAACTKETLRRYPAVVLASPRKVTKNFKICGKQIYKGDYINYAPLAVHVADEHFEAGEKFNPDRFVDTKLKNKHSYIPFTTGPRICVGLHFGEMIVKLVGLSLAKRFKVSKIEGFQYRNSFTPLFGFESCKFKIKLRDE